MTNKLNNSKQYPLVSIITPAYNRADLIEETIFSVLNQSYPNIEYIVIDDGSKDNTLEIIKKYEDKLLLLTQDNIGETKTVNKGLRLAKGDIIGIINSDDPLLPDAVTTVVKEFLNNPEIIVFYPDWQMIDSEGNIIEYVRTFDYSYENMLRWQHCVPGPGTFFRRIVVDELKGRDENFRYVADFDFWLRAGLLGSFKRIPKIIATFRVHPGSASVNSRGVSMAEEQIKLIKKYYSSKYLTINLLGLKNESFSSAHYIAGCLTGSSPSLLKLSYFLKAFYFCPRKYFGEYRKRLLVIIAQILYIFLRIKK